VSVSLDYTASIVTIYSYSVSRTLDRVIRDIEPSLKKHKAWHGTAMNVRDEGGRIKEAIREMNDAFDKFTVSVPKQ
jgi:hypothetical protein